MDNGRQDGAATRFSATYRILAEDPDAAALIAAAIALEQTVEVPAQLVPPAVAAAEIPGRVEAVDPDPDAPAAAPAYLARISFRSDLVRSGIGALLNVSFGNVSLVPGVRLVALDLPPALIQALPGPGLGAAGVRALTGVAGRPLTAAAIKPMGQPVPRLAALAGALARGGIDLVKDDHGLIDQPFHPFAERVRACRDAVAAAGTGAVYVPMVTGDGPGLEARFAFLAAEGIRMVMLAPLISGLDGIGRLARSHGLGLMAHPSFTGALVGHPDHGIAPGLLLGTLFRLAGVDVSIFPNAGGRFATTEADCRAIAAALRGPMGPVAPALPAPAGGMRIAAVDAMLARFGRDAVFLIGGDLLAHPDGPEAGARAFRAAIAAGLRRQEAAA